MKQVDRDFQLFQFEFKKWQKQFGLTGYHCYFNYEPDDSHFATITKNQTNMVATVSLNSALPEKDKNHKNIKGTAKHEALHLLICRLEDCARNRYVSEETIYEACEELVVKLESLIP